MDKNEILQSMTLDDILEAEELIKKEIKKLQDIIAGCNLFLSDRMNKYHKDYNAVASKKKRTSAQIYQFRGSLVELSKRRAFLQGVKVETNKTSTLPKSSTDTHMLNIVNKIEERDAE